MSTVTIEDICLWPKHIEGNPALEAKLLSLAEGELIILKIDGVSSVWKKMNQGKNPNPTPGLKPACDLCRNWWRTMFETRKGERVSISFAEGS